MNDEAGGDAEIVLRFAAGCRFREAREQILDLRGTERQAMEDLHVNATAEGCSERVASTGSAEGAAARVRDTKKSLRKRREAFMVAIGNPRAEEIRGNSAVNARAENVVGMIAAEISDAAEPVVCVVRDGGAATVKIKTTYAGRAGIIAEIRISDEDVELRYVLGGRDRRDGKHCEQAHYDLPLHTASLRFGFIAGTRASGATLRTRAASGRGSSMPRRLSRLSSYKDAVDFAEVAEKRKFCSQRYS